MLQENSLRMIRGKNPVLVRTFHKPQFMGQRSYLPTRSKITQAHGNGTHGCAGRTTTRDTSWNTGDKLWHGRSRILLEWECFPTWLPETHIKTCDSNVGRNLGKGGNFTLGDPYKQKDREKQT